MMKDALPAVTFAASSGLTAPLRGGDESTTWLGSDEQSLNASLLKARKPYTITKQRERWSEEEHLRFVEALRLHGRAWRKIEEHIGTKTAVQIRSHAQKFFNKLEKKKEAGEMVEKEEDLAIPPPRPKRKPAKPYPRKDAFSASGAADTSQLQYSSAEVQAAQQQLLGSYGYGSTPTGGATAAAQHFGNFINTFAGHSGASTVSDATVAAVTAAASAAAAAAAAAVVAAAGQEVQSHMQAHPPSCFPFFGMPPSALAQITPAHGGASALDQATLLGRFTAGVKHEGLISADPLELGLVDCSVLRGLMEATGTTDGTHVSAGAQPCGSGGDSSCSLETDDQNAEADDATNSWQTRPFLALQHQQQQLQQHNGSASSAAAAAAPSLAAAAAQGGFDLSQLPWGLARQEYGTPAARSSATTAFPVATPAHALALLSNPFYQAGLAAADRAGQQGVASLQAAAAAACGNLREAKQAAAAGLTCSGGDAMGSSGALDAAMPDVSGRTRSRKKAPSVNSGSTGPPVGTKRLFAVGSEECLMPIKKVAREATDDNDDADNDDADGMEVTPSSPSIEEKEVKAVSQPSNTNGNTSGSNESEGSKRRPGTAQAEGSNPTNGNSSGNGYSVKDSNTGTNTCTNGHTNGYSCGNGTSAFNPVGHHHHAHQAGAAHHAQKANHQQQLGSNGVTSRHQHHHHSNHAVHALGAEGSTAAYGASGTGFASGRDEGRSSSDLEGPVQQLTKASGKLQLHRSAEADDEVMVPVSAADLREQQQDSEQATQLQALLASLHGMCSNPVMMQQAYDAAAAAAAAAQQIVANAVQGNQQSGVSAQQQIAALQQQICQNSAAQQGATTSQGFSPWHGSSAKYGGAASSSFVSSGLLQQLGQRPAAQQLQAATGLMGLAGSWGAGGAPAAAGGTNSLLSTYAQLAAAAAAARQQQQHQQHTHQHQHSHYHYHPQQQQQQRAGSAAVAAAAVGLQQLQQGFRHSSTSQQAAGLSSYGLSGLEVLTRIAAGGVPEAEDAAAAAATQRRALTQGEGVADAGLAKRQS